MSIFKDTFPDFVSKQINKRQNVYMGRRDPQDISYLNSRKAWVKLTSGVNTATGLFDDNNQPLYDNSLSKQYVLQGGTLYDNSLNGAFTGSLREGFGGIHPVYNNVTPSGKIHRLGIRPMPGITDVDIKSKSAYGSLREATVKFVCWDITQLEDLELLYMRPGFTALLEWGWSPYINNEEEYTTRVDYDNNVISDNPTGTLQEIYKTLYDKSVKQSANYDAMVGFIKNFQWSFRKDGGYDCSTTIISFGEVLESLKINYTSPDEKISGGLLGEEVVIEKGSINNIYDKSKLAGIIYEVANILAKRVPKEDLKDKLETNGIVFAGNIDGEIYDLAAYQIDINNESENKLPNSEMWQYYITIESFFKLLNKYILLTSNKGNIVSLSVKDREYYGGGDYLKCLTHPLQLSVDPTICLINSPVWGKGFGFPKVSNNNYEIQPDAIHPSLGNPTYKNEASTLVQSIIDFNLDKAGNKTVIENNIIVYFANKTDKDKALEEIIKQYEIKRGKKIKVELARITGKETIKTEVLETGQIKSTKGRSPQIFANDAFGLSDKTFGYLTFKQFTDKSGIIINNDLITVSLDSNRKSKFNNILNSQTSLTNIDKEAEKEDEYNKASEQASELSKVNLKFLLNLKPFYVDNDPANGLGNINNIYLNLNYCYSLILDNNMESKEQKEINLYDYLKEIINNVQNSIGNINNFDIHVDPIDNIGRIIDINTTISSNDDSFNNPTIIEIQKADNISSFVRDVSLQSQIFPEQSTMVAISAQTKGGTMGINNETLVGFNRGIQDRVLRDKFTPSFRDITNEQRLINLKEAIGRLVTYLSELNYLYNNNPLQDNKHGVYSKDNSDDYKNALKNIINTLKSITNDPNQFRAIIPTKLSITMDGIGGMIIGNVFSIPEENLPAGYKGDKGIGRKMGHIVTGIGHKISTTDWTTIIDAQTIVLSEADKKVDMDYSDILIINPTTSQYELNIGGVDPNNKSLNSTLPFDKNKLTEAVKFFLGKGFTKNQTSAIVGALLQESGLKTTHVEGKPYGIAQWLGSRKTKLKTKSNYDTLNTQLNYVMEEFNGGEREAFRKIKSSSTLEEAVTGMASYERYGGWTKNSTFNQLLSLPETGKRISYAEDILRRIENGEFQ